MRLCFSLYAALTLALFSVMPVLAAEDTPQETWVNYVSEDGVVRSRMPYGYEQKSERFMISKSQAIGIGEASGKIDAREKGGSLKTYLVKYEQTFGQPFNYKDEIQDLWTREFDSYKESYPKAEVISLQSGTFKSFPVSELILNYQDETLGEQAIRISILFAKNTRIKQVAIGPPSSITAFKTEDFFQNLVFLPDPIENAQDILNVWQPRTSPSKIFTVYAPPKSESFMPKDEVIKKGTRTDVINFIFKDPAREQFLAYNVYGYVFKEGTNLTYSDVSAVIRSNHVLKQRPHDQGIVYNRRVADQFGVVEAQYLIETRPGEPYMDSARIQAIFKGNIMVVQETNSSLEVQKGPFVETLFQAIKFHPEQYTP